MRGSPTEAEPEGHLGPDQSTLTREGTAKLGQNSLQAPCPVLRPLSQDTTGDLLQLPVPVLGDTGLSQAPPEGREQVFIRTGRLGWTNGQNTKNC